MYSLPFPTLCVSQEADLQGVTLGLRLPNGRCPWATLAGEERLEYLSPQLHSHGVTRGCVPGRCEFWTSRFLGLGLTRAPLVHLAPGYFSTPCGFPVCAHLNDFFNKQTSDVQFGPCHLFPLGPRLITWVQWNRVLSLALSLSATAL